jgi:hypothetical protein
MKAALLVLCFLGATAALGQTAGGSGSAMMSSTVQMSSHDQHASQTSLAQEQSLLEHSNFFYVQGERPLWEVQAASKSHAVPLGDIARMLRKEHEATKKADFVFND